MSSAGAGGQSSRNLPPDWANEFFWSPAAERWNERESLTNWQAASNKADCGFTDSQCHPANPKSPTLTHLFRNSWICAPLTAMSSSELAAAQQSIWPRPQPQSFAIARGNPSSIFWKEWDADF